MPAEVAVGLYGKKYLSKYRSERDAAAPVVASMAITKGNAHRLLCQSEDHVDGRDHLHGLSVQHGGLSKSTAGPPRPRFPPAADFRSPPVNVQWFRPWRSRRPAGRFRETRARLASSGYAGITLRISLAACTSPPCGTGFAGVSPVPGRSRANGAGATVGPIGNRDWSPIRAPSRCRLKLRADQAHRR